MTVNIRRWLGFAGGVLAGVGLGGLTSSAASDLDYYLQRIYSFQNPNSIVGFNGYAPTAWIPSLTIGVGLGLAIAAVIR